MIIPRLDPVLCSYLLGCKQACVKTHENRFALCSHRHRSVRNQVETSHEDAGWVSNAGISDFSGLLCSFEKVKSRWDVNFKRKGSRTNTKKVCESQSTQSVFTQECQIFAVFKVVMFFSASYHLKLNKWFFLKAATPIRNISCCHFTLMSKPTHHYKVQWLTDQSSPLVLNKLWL